MQIWSLCDSEEKDSLNREGLYKSLTLLALAQQGKTVDKTTLSSLGNSGTHHLFTHSFV